MSLSRDVKKRWLKVGEGPPLAPITDLQLHAATNTLHAATFGRGIYRLSLTGL